MKKLLAILTLLPLSLIAAEPTASVGLAWNANSESDLAGYRLYRGTNSGVYTFVKDVGNVTTTTDTNLVEGVTYYFVVTAYNVAGLESEPSNQVSYKVPLFSLPVPPSSNRVTQVIIEQVRVDTTTNRVVIFP